MYSLSFNGVPGFYAQNNFDNAFTLTNTFNNNNSGNINNNSNNCKRSHKKHTNSDQIGNNPTPLFNVINLDRVKLLITF
jgi:hypothetical protein